MCPRHLRRDQKCKLKYVYASCSSAAVENVCNTQWLNGTKEGCDGTLYMTGVVEAWTGGSSWDQVTEDCNLDDGDIARLLNRRALQIACQSALLKNVC